MNWFLLSGSVCSDVQTTGSCRSNEPVIAELSPWQREPEYYPGRAATRGNVRCCIAVFLEVIGNNPGKPRE